MRHQLLLYKNNKKNTAISLSRTQNVLTLCGILLGLLSCSNNYEGNPNATVHIKKEEGHYVLHKNGVPFYIQGASGNSHFDELHKIGGNTIRVYDTTGLKNTLDRAQISQLAVIVDLPLPRFTPQSHFYRNKQNIEQLLDTYEKLIIRHASHPALLAWNLGNEVNYPIHPKYDYFYTVFNDLLALIHKRDPNHPVSTSLSISMLRRKIFSLRWHSPDLDFVSLNVFGKLKEAQQELSSISWFWDGPYLLSEWGINGPWETRYTSWQAPIESTSTKKAEHLKDRYLKYIKKKAPNSLGNLVFYWGQKQERTHTWFSLFDKKGYRTQQTQELQKLWSKQPIKNIAPQINYMLLDQKGALDNCLFAPGVLKQAQIFLNDPVNNSLKIHWELLPENWGYNLGDPQYQPPVLNNFNKQQNKTDLIFETPKKEGAYRLFAHIYDNHGNVASANTPFYVLKSAHD